MFTRLMLYCCVLMVFFVLSAGAEDRFGISVYPGAKTDGSTAWYAKKYAEGFEKQLKNKSAIEVFCYRTGDDFMSVVGFYKKQQKITLLTVNDKGAQKSAMFCGAGMKCASMGNGLDVTVMTPWADDKA